MGNDFSTCFYFVVNIKPTMEREKITSWRLRFCYSGCELLRIFLISMLISAVYILAMIPVVFKENKLLWLFNLLLCIFVRGGGILNGIIRLYISSVQIGIKMACDRNYVRFYSDCKSYCAYKTYAP